MAQRITEDFVRNFDLLKSRTGNSPHNLGNALKRDGQLAVTIQKLSYLWSHIQERRRFSRRRFIVQAHPKFHDAFTDYEARWRDKAITSLFDWEAEQRGEKPLSALVGEFQAGMSQEQEVYEWDFDPDEHSVASLVEWAEDLLEEESGGYPDNEEYSALCSQAAGALKWIRDSIGLDIATIAGRWNRFPVITVPEHVSNRHGIEDHTGLFAYLNNVRLAYMIGADLAAIAMCRAATEILMREHYNRDDTTKLTPLIKSTQAKREFTFLRPYNLVAKVNESNNILHFNRDDINHRDRSAALIMEWVTALQAMIVRAPSG